MYRNTVSKVLENLNKRIKEKKKNPSGRQWSPDFCCMTPPIWVSEASVAKESSALGRGVGRGTAAARRHFAFWNASCAEVVHFNVFVPPSGDRLEVSKLVHNWAENSCKSLPCRENVAVAWCPEGGGGGQFAILAILSPKSCVEGFPEKVLQKHIFQVNGEAIGG